MSPASPAAMTQSGGSWRAALGAWLQARRTYPDAARQRGDEGTAIVRCSVARSGEVLAIKLLRSSGSETLDRAAMAIFRDTRLPPFGSDMSMDQITITVPIRYRLER
jgi:protein TonB